MNAAVVRRKTLRRKTSILACLLGAGLLRAVLSGAHAEVRSTEGELIERLHAAQASAAYPGSAYYKGKSISALPTLVMKPEDSVIQARQMAVAGNQSETEKALRPAEQSRREVRIASGSSIALASRDPNGDDQVDSLNAAQLGAAYAGPVYYKGQAIPAARPVLIDAGKTAAPAKNTAPTFAGAGSGEGTPRPVSQSATDAYHGALYHPAGNSPLPPPQAH